MPERWRRIEAVLDAVLAAPAEERDATLQRAAGDDQEVLKEVASLLAAHAKAEGFLATSAESFAAPYLKEAAASEPGDRPGLIVGRYRLIEQIGRGGMGTVWLAERSDGQFEHRVALKLIKRGMDSDEILARFLRERQILARLEHPHIARLLDGGVNDDGRPYFVMEYVAGRAITRHCDEQRLAVDERLRLLVTACRAIGYAHRNLVVHRDVKPSNVLVDERGELKLLDFGIARLLGDEDSPALTAGTGRLMTPEYASPEQLTGRSVTTASDVYQLGILLYELLTGQRPRGAEAGETTRRPSGAVRRTVTVLNRNGSKETIEPRAVSTNRATTPERLQRRLRGDLDVIALRALRAEPDRRYPSAADLAEDLERHLANRPIRFGGDRASYRARKFVRRHRLGVATGAGALLLTLGLLGFDAFRVRQERDRARHEADKAVEVGQLMARFLEGWSPDASDRGAVSTRKLLADAATRAAKELQNRPEILAATLSILGDFHTTVGEWRAADTLLARALVIQQQLNSSPSADLAATVARRGRLEFKIGQYAGASTDLQQALALHRKVFGARHPETLRVQQQLAQVYRSWKKPQDAESLLRDILAGLEQQGSEPSPFALEVASDLGYTMYQQARYDEAIAILRPSLAQQRALFGDIHLATLTTIHELASVLRDRGDIEEAESLYRDGLRITRALFGEEHPETETSLFILALALARKGDLEEAERLMRQSRALGERLFGSDNVAGWYRTGFLGVIRLDRGDPVEAEKLLRQSLAQARETAPPDDPDRGDVLNRLAYLLVSRGAADADAVYRAAVAFDDARPPELADFVTDGIHFLAWAEQRKGDTKAAEQDYRRALRIYERQLPANHPYLIAARQGLETLPP